MPTGRQLYAIMLLAVLMVLGNISFYVFNDKRIIWEAIACLRKQVYRETSIAHLTVNTTTMCEDVREFDFRTCMTRKLVCYNKTVENKTPAKLLAVAEYECSHLMGVAGYLGRLGNIMFQTAAVIGIATRHGYTPVFDKKSELFKLFKLMNGVSFKLNTVHSMGERVCCEYNRKIEHLDHSYNWTLSGYLQSWKYFQGVDERVRNAFSFKNVYRDKVQNYLRDIIKQDSLLIGVHVRRGDFISGTKLGYVAAPVSYIRNAMQHFLNLYKRVHFMFASDDIKWCRENFKTENVHFSPFQERELDMALLVSCNHSIITAGSFSWWTGWLSKGTTVYYKGFPKKGSWLETQFNTSNNYDDYYPRNWIGMF